MERLAGSGTTKPLPVSSKTTPASLNPPPDVVPYRLSGYFAPIAGCRTAPTPNGRQELCLSGA